MNKPIGLMVIILFPAMAMAATHVDHVQSYMKSAETSATIQKVAAPALPQPLTANQIVTLAKSLSSPAAIRERQAVMAAQAKMNRADMRRVHYVVSENHKIWEQGSFILGTEKGGVASMWSGPHHTSSLVLSLHHDGNGMDMLRVLIKKAYVSTFLIDTASIHQLSIRETIFLKDNEPVNITPAQGIVWRITLEQSPM